MLNKLYELIINFCKTIIYHTPTHRLNNKEKEQIKMYGLIHFCEAKNFNSIKAKGVIGGLKEPMVKKEKDFTWYYINLSENFEKNKKIVRSKGNRKKYDGCIIVKNLSDEQLDLLRIRREIDDAVIYPGTLKTDDIKGFMIG